MEGISGSIYTLAGRVFVSHGSGSSTLLNKKKYEYMLITEKNIYEYIFDENCFNINLMCFFKFI